ncbi:MAG: hypothetical protein HLUCCA13_08815 [Halomonas sp. HL-48]|nr:MAG: hypothetical protein HLUCCA13_08815 [Halomonas sp. HL-48]
MVIGACVSLAIDAGSAADACCLRVKVTLYPRLPTDAAVIKSELTPLNRHLKMVLT